MHTIYTLTVDTDDDCSMFFDNKHVDSPYTVYFDSFVKDDVISALRHFSFKKGCANYMNRLVADAVSDLNNGFSWFCYGGNQTVGVSPYEIPDKEDFYHAV